MSRHAARLAQLADNEIDLRIALTDVKQEIASRFVLADQLLDDLRANRAEQRRLLEDEDDFAEGVLDTFGPEIAALVTKSWGRR